MVHSGSPAAPTAPDPERPEGQAVPESVQRDKLSLIGHMASSIAHELSNPLATIVASAQAILSFWPRPGTPGAPVGGSRDPWSAPAEFTGHGVPLRQLREDLELILEEARRAGDIVHGLLASARQDPPEWRICSLADVVRRTVGLCRHHLKLHNISLQSPYFDVHDGFPLWSRVRGDANQLQQVLLNLIVNAQQAITASRGYGTVRITLAPDGPDRVTLAVEDDGPGVPQDQRDLIFRPFYTTKPAGQGTGLGLSISAGILDTHGGKLSLESHPQGGAIFRITLPSLAASDRDRGHAQVREHSPAEVMLPPPVADAAARSLFRRILLVDDEVGIRRSVGRFLRRFGYEVTDVPSAQAAITALRGGQFDAVISDLRMPGTSGEEFHAALQREFPDTARRVIFTSGDTMREETRQFLSASGCPSLQKPYELGELLQLLETLCPPVAGITHRVSA